MLESNLAIALGIFLEKALKNLHLQTKSGELRAPQVVDGYLPPKRTTDDEDFPFVVVRVEDGSSEQGKTVASVVFVIGCYSTETDGYTYCMEVMQRIRQALCELPAQTLDKKFQLTFPILWSNVADQPYPYWQIEMTTKWTFNTPQMTNF